MLQYLICFCSCFFVSLLVNLYIIIFFCWETWLLCFHFSNYILVICPLSFPVLPLISILHSSFLPNLLLCSIFIPPSFFHSFSPHLSIYQYFSLKQITSLLYCRTKLTVCLSSPWALKTLNQCLKETDILPLR